MNRDAIGCTVKVCKIATGDLEEELDETRSRHSNASRAGGWARAEAPNPERRSEIAAQAKKARWED